MSQENGFLIFGRVLASENEEALSGLKVLALDKDLISDDCLGTALTDKNGYFEIKFARKDFRDHAFEGRPDVYLQVLNEYGNLVWSSQDKVRYGASDAEQFDIRIPRSVLIKQPIENERAQFTNLLKVNPNYFGTALGPLAELYQPVVTFSGNTLYEDLCGIGLYPHQDLLEAIIRIKRPFGYSGNICTLGSTEYVRFFIDYGDGNGWQAAGTPAKVRVHNLAAAAEDNIHYAVRTHFEPKYIKDCSDPQIVKVRAILSWNQMPFHANYTPVYGQVVEEYVQIRPESTLVLGYDPGFKVPVWELEDIVAGPEVPEPPGPPPVETFFEEAPLQLQGKLSEIEKLVRNSQQVNQKEVEEARFNFLPILQKNPNYFGSFSQSSEVEQIAKDLSLLPQAVLPSFQQLNPEVLIPGLLDNPKTKYEELTCVGLYPEEGILEATLHLKRESGYNGNLCSKGSREYVSFYVDYGGGYELAGTTSVKVADISRPNQQNPLAYAVRLPIPDLEDRLKACNVENVVTVRAILSWNVNPEPFGPHYNPGWGNRRTVKVILRPQEGPSATCAIDIVSGLDMVEIDQAGLSTPGSLGVGHALKAGATDVFDRPFGNLMEFRGRVDVSGATHYKFTLKPYGAPDSAYAELDDPYYHVVREFGGIVGTQKRSPSIGKWFSIGQYKQDTNLILNPHGYKSGLLHWDSKKRPNGTYTMRLQLGYSLGSSVHELAPHECTVHFVVHNAAIQTHDFLTSTVSLPSNGVTVKDEWGHPQRCGEFKGSNHIHIWGNFSHDYYRNYALRVFGGNIHQAGYSLNGLAAGSPNLSPTGWYDQPLAKPPAPPTAGTSTTGSFVQGDGTTGSELFSFDLSQAPTVANAEHVKCAYGIRITLYARTVWGGFSQAVGFTHHTIHTSRYATFNWEP
jgi:hypothetical protein